MVLEMKHFEDNNIQKDMGWEIVNSQGNMFHLGKLSYLSHQACSMIQQDNTQVLARSR